MISSLTTTDTSYYQSDSETASVRVADDRTVDYGVPANNSAFEQVVRVLKYIANCVLDANAVMQSNFPTAVG